MKLLHVFLIVVLTLLVFNWIAQDHPNMGLGDILPSPGLVTPLITIMQLSQ